MSRHTHAGFTLIETTIYIGLFSILMVGVIVSIQPILQGAERMSEKIMIENEVALVSRTIISQLPQTKIVTSPSTPTPGNPTTGNTLSLNVPVGPPGGVNYSFSVSGGAIVALVMSPPWTALTASRVRFDDMTVTRVAASAGTPQYVEITYMVDGNAYGPIRSYLNF